MVMVTDCTFMVLVIALVMMIAYGACGGDGNGYGV